MNAATFSRPTSRPHRLKLKAGRQVVTPRPSPPRIVLGAPGDLHSRAPIWRMVRIHCRLCPTVKHGWAGQVNCSTLAEELECDPKTIRRDVEFMRDSLNLPIDYDAALRSFFYTRPVNVIFGVDPAMVGKGVEV